LGRTEEVEAAVGKGEN